MSMVGTPEEQAQVINDAIAGDMPVIEKPPSGLVKLARGLWRNGGWATDAVVRELNGADEEVYSRINPFDKPLEYQDCVLSRGVVTIGGAPVQLPELGELIIGDRNALYLAIRIATYGDKLEFKGECEHCSTPIDIEVDLTDDIPVLPGKDPLKDLHEVPLRNGSILYLKLPTGHDQTASFAGAGAVNVSERNSLLMSKCIKKLNGESLSDPFSYAKNLGLRDRAKVLEFLTQSQPGPQPGEVEVPCSACGGEITINLSWANLLRF